MKRILLICAAAIMVMAGGCWVWWTRTFPYGYREPFAPGWGMSLLAYADDNGGVFPSGGSTPEASLRLLYPKWVSSAEMWAGKTGSIELAESRLASGKELGPEACGWIYVTGLSPDYSWDVAVLWDRAAGFGRHAERRADNGREVVFVNGSTGWIPASEWEAFMQKQERLRAEGPRPKQPNK